MKAQIFTLLLVVVAMPKNAYCTQSEDPNLFDPEVGVPSSCYNPVLTEDPLVGEMAPLLPNMAGSMNRQCVPASTDHQKKKKNRFKLATIFQAEISCSLMKLDPWLDSKQSTLPYFKIATAETQAALVLNLPNNQLLSLCPKAS